MITLQKLDVSVMLFTQEENAKDIFHEKFIGTHKKEASALI